LKVKRAKKVYGDKIKAHRMRLSEKEKDIGRKKEREKLKVSTAIAMLTRTFWFVDISPLLVLSPMMTLRSME
jgi:hypothetical protein